MTTLPPDAPVPTDGGGVFCRACHAEMAPDATFCPNCGQARNEVPTVTEAVPVVAAPVAPVASTTVRETFVDDPVVVDDRAWWASPGPILLALAAFVILLAVIIAASNSSDDTPTTTTILTTPTTVATTVATAPAPPVIIQQPGQTVYIQPEPTQAPTTTAP